nr:MAG TPA: hypothetical protein [Caudoviricetes sp.]
MLFIIITNSFINLFNFTYFSKSHYYFLLRLKLFYYYTKMIYIYIYKVNTDRIIRV